MSDGTTIGIWVGENDDVVDQFDEKLGTHPKYSRSESIKDAMALKIAVEEVLDEVGYDFDSERSKRHWVRQALLDHARDEISPE
ncbi:hypothetical protein ACFFQF_01055 [Haladaptatus pallidirubidus]|uniref:hypothetical protein n=1 Tax=Haladaptatus pallidirubidus TaxID=1008152 RepID=UPI001D1074D6|nr:hypothetical protein [Haladaptatus pallidirubidus]